MKNSPGFHRRGHRVDDLGPGGAGRPDDLEDLVDPVVLHADDDRRVRLLQEAARRVQPGGAMIPLEEAVDERAGVLAVDDGDDESHRPSIRAGPRRRATVYDAAAEPARQPRHRLRDRRRDGPPHRAPCHERRCPRPRTRPRPDPGRPPPGDRAGGRRRGRRGLPPGPRPTRAPADRDRRDAVRSRPGVRGRGAGRRSPDRDRGSGAGRRLRSGRGHARRPEVSSGPTCPWSSRPAGSRPVSG